MCVDTIRCGGYCPECQEEARKRREREERAEARRIARQLAAERGILVIQEK
jgi:hypothetical protein